MVCKINFKNEIILWNEFEKWIYKWNWYMNLKSELKHGKEFKKWIWERKLNLGNKFQNEFP